MLTTVALLIVGTSVEWRLEKKGVKFNTALRILSFFSARRNTRRLFRDPAESTNSSLQFVNGLKVMLSFWIVLGHTYAMVQPDMIGEPGLHDEYEATRCIK